MRRQNTPGTANDAPQLFEANVPLDAELLLSYMKKTELAPELGRAQRKLADHEVQTVFDQIVQKVYERKVVTAQLRYDAAEFVTGTMFQIDHVATADEVPLLRVANHMVYDGLKDLHPTNMTGRALARSALITLTPLETPSPPDTLAA